MKEVVRNLRQEFFAYLFAGLFCLLGIPGGHCAAWVCLDANAPIDAQSGDIAAFDNLLCYFL
jgi:hypothetical protein